MNVALCLTKPINLVSFILIKVRLLILLSINYLDVLFHCQSSLILFVENTNVFRFMRPKVLTQFKQTESAAVGA